MDRDLDYYSLRERRERAAAKKASSAAARRVHQELAEQYSRLAQSDLRGDLG